MGTEYEKRRLEREICELFVWVKTCSEHFEKNQFLNKKTILLKNRLIWNAVPTIFSIANPPESYFQEISPKRDLLKPYTK